MNELVEFGTSGFANIPYSTVFVMVLFMMDTAVSSATAKLYFVCGYFIELLLFYAIGRVCFPSMPKGSDSSVAVGKDNERSSDMIGGGGNSQDKVFFNMMRYLAKPLQRYTDASFFNFSAGYILGYWGNLNILLQTPNATMTVFYYVVFVLLVFLYSVFYLSTAQDAVCSWQSGLVSATMGVFGGMICAQIIYPLIQQSYTAPNNTHTTNALPNGVPEGSVACDSGSKETICKVFQATSN